MLNNSNSKFQINFRDTKCLSLEDMVNVLYHHLVDNKIFSLENITVIQYYQDFPIIKYYLKIHDNTLILYNENNHIQLISLFPEYTAIDNFFIKEYQNVILMDKQKINPYPTKTLETPKNGRHQSLLARANIVKQSIQNQLNEKKNLSFDDDFENLKEKQRNERIEYGKNMEKFRIFESDKKSYVRIRNDIEKGLLKKDDIHPAFILKYQIFKILEERNSIDFGSDDKINEEYNVYNDLYNVCQDDDDITEPTNKIYIPHNYHYMSDEKKEEHAKKYKMSRKEFEDKYLNSIIDSIDYHDYHMMDTTQSINGEGMDKTVLV